MLFDNEKLNLELVNDKYSSFMKRLDLTLLGMGSDGHTTSIFPNDLESERIMNTKNIGIYSTKRLLNFHSIELHVVRKLLVIVMMFFYFLQEKLNLIYLKIQLRQMFRFHILSKNMITWKLIIQNDG